MLKVPSDEEAKLTPGEKEAVKIFYFKQMIRDLPFIDII